jgi:hypothetical protein
LFVLCRNSISGRCLWTDLRKRMAGTSALQIRMRQRAEQSLVESRGGVGWPERGSVACRNGSGGVCYRNGLAGVRGAAPVPTGMGRGRVHHRIFNTEAPRSPTEKSNIALRAKRLNLPDAANETTKSPSPEPPWILRVLRGENAEANAPRTCPDRQRNAARLLQCRIYQCLFLRATFMSRATSNAASSSNP